MTQTPLDTIPSRICASCNSLIEDTEFCAYCGISRYARFAPTIIVRAVSYYKPQVEDFLRRLQEHSTTIALVTTDGDWGPADYLVDSAGFWNKVSHMFYKFQHPPCHAFAFAKGDDNGVLKITCIQGGWKKYGALLTSVATQFTSDGNWRAEIDQGN